MHSVLQWTYQLLKVIAAVQATNDQVVLQPTMEESSFVFI
jgi:hypothetical protein